MAWSDKPTENQINAMFNLLKWVVSREEFHQLRSYLMELATRRDVSKELGRLRDLTIERKLTRDTAFESELWKDYNN